MKTIPAFFFATTFIGLKLARFRRSQMKYYTVGWTIMFVMSVALFSGPVGAAAPCLSLNCPRCKTWCNAAGIQYKHQCNLKHNKYSKNYDGVAFNARCKAQIDRNRNACLIYCVGGTQDSWLPTLTSKRAHRIIYHCLRTGSSEAKWQWLDRKSACEGIPLNIPSLQHKFSVFD